MSRTARIVRAVTIGYGFQAVVALTGLVLTPFMLVRLGVDDYGRWLVIGQFLGLLGLLDLGVIAVLPREVARTSGTVDGESLAEVVRRVRWLVWLQMPMVGLVAAGVWLSVTGGRPELGRPLAVILVAFVLQFPLRVPGAILAGLQDLAFCGIIQAASWLVTTTVTVLLVLAGWGLMALASGWVIGQAVSCGAAWWRLRVRYSEACGCGRWPGWSALTAHFAPSAWTSVRQLSQFLLSGSELLILDWVAGPATVVVYSCTVKLVTIVANQPYLIVISAFPAVAELQATGDWDRVWRACRALGLVMMMVSGTLAIAVLAVNRAFVPSWVGPENYAGPTTTFLMVMVMACRHLVFTMSQTVFALGYDRRLSVVAFADGVVIVFSTIGWVKAVGLLGVPLGSLTGLLLTNGLVTVFTLAAVQGVSVARALRWTVPWLVRFVAVAGPVTCASFTSVAGNPVVAGGLLVGGLAAYTILILPLLSQEPLCRYWNLVRDNLRLKLGLIPAVSGGIQK